MVMRAIAAGPHLIVTCQPGQLDGWLAGPGESAGRTIGGQAGPAAVTHGGRPRPVSVLASGRHNDADARAAAAALRQLAD